MEIEIKGYKNLKDLKISLVDKRINIVFGISGSGKSSISYALQHREMDRNRTIGFYEEQTVKVNGEDNPFSVCSFSKDAIDDFILVRNKSEIQSVLIESGGVLSKAEEELNRQLLALQNALQGNKEHYDFLCLLKKELGSNLTKEGHLKTNSRIVGLERSFEKVKSQRIWNRIAAMPTGKFAWLKNGNDYMEDGICPFCERRISKRQIRIIEKTNSFEKKTIDAVLNLPEDDSYSIIQEDTFTKNGISRLKADIIEAIKALDSFDEIEKQYIKIREFEIGDKIEPFVLSPQLMTYFPEVYENACSTNAIIERLTRLVEGAKKQTKKILSGRLGKINGYLRQMSLPFRLEADYANGHIKNYKIVYADDDSKQDRPDGLSEGEKCILAQLMFVFQCKTANEELIIIDDPASAYDDIRRNQMLEVVKRELDGHTVLILSHDTTYAKYILSGKGKKGMAFFLENYGDAVTLRAVEKSDFGEFDDFVLNRINEVDDYFQKIINLRLLYEGNHKDIVYSYLSAIVHRISPQNLQKELAEVDITEEEIFGMIKERYPQLKLKDIPKYKDSFSPDLSAYTLLEKAFYFRELLDEKEKWVKIELNDMVHINRSLKICLNPYKFNLCTRELYFYIESKTNDYLRGEHNNE